MSNLMAMFKLSRKSQSNLSEWTKDDDKLVQAVELGQPLKDIQRLIQKKKVSPNKLDPQGHSAFHVAAMRNRFEALQLFLAYGARTDSTDAQGRTALHCAARHGAAEAIEVLIQCKEDAWPPDGSGMTALHHACISGNLDCVVSLLRKFQKDIHSVDEDGRTPLCHAAHIGHTAVCKELLDRGASPDTGDNSGRTCLMCASENGNTAACELFVAQGANLSLADKHGHTALWYAIDAGHSSVKFILEQASGICHEAVTDQADSGSSKRDVHPILEENEYESLESDNESKSSWCTEDKIERCSYNGSEARDYEKDTKQPHVPADSNEEGVDAPLLLLQEDALRLAKERQRLGVEGMDVGDGISLSDDSDSVEVSSLSSSSTERSLLEELKNSYEIGQGTLEVHEVTRQLPEELSSSNDKGDGQRLTELQTALIFERRKNAELSEQLVSLKDRLAPKVATPDAENTITDSDDETDEEESHCDQQADSRGGRLEGRPVAKVSGQQRKMSIKEETREIASLREAEVLLRTENARLQAALEESEEARRREGSSSGWKSSSASDDKLAVERQRNAALVLSNAAVQRELDEVQQRAAALTDNDVRLAYEVTDLLQKNSKLDGELLSLLDKFRDAEKENGRLATKLGLYKDEYRKVKERLKKQDLLRKKLEQENHAQGKQIRKLAARLHADEERAHTWQHQLQTTAVRLSAENDGLLDECEEFATEAARLRDKLDDKNYELTKMSDLLESNGAILNLKQKEMQSLEKQVALLRDTSMRQQPAASKECNALKKQVLKLQQQLSDTSEKHKEIVDAYRNHLICALEGRLSEDVRQALEAIIELRRMQT